MAERAWRYHSKYKAKIFEGEEIAKAEDAGWVDSPAKVEPVEDTGNSEGSNSTGDSNEDNESGNGSDEGNSTNTVVVLRESTEEEVELGFQIPEDLKELSGKKLKKLCKARAKTNYSNLKQDGLIALLEG